MNIDDEPEPYGPVVAIGQRDVRQVRPNGAFSLLKHLWRARAERKIEFLAASFEAKPADGMDERPEHEVDIAAFSLADAIAGAFCSPMQQGTGKPPGKRK